MIRPIAAATTVDRTGWSPTTTRLSSRPGPLRADPRRGGAGRRPVRRPLRWSNEHPAQLLGLVRRAVRRERGRHPDIREIIYSANGTTVKRWDRLGERTSGDSSHRWHTHFSFFRDAIKAGRDQRPLFRRYLGTIGLLEDDMTPKNTTGWPPYTRTSQCWTVATRSGRPTPGWRWVRTPPSRTTPRRTRR
ncbi:hypothetical protein NKG94_48450 [Micromonospora sp. M12]